MKNGVAIATLIIVFAVSGVACGEAGPSQSSGISVSHHEINSVQMKEQRTFWVAQSPGFSSSTAPILRIVSFDADNASFHEPITQCPSLEGRRYIVVGIANTNRSRDMFPVQVTGRRHIDSGGGRLFLDFITKELLPFLDSTYGTPDYSILMGYSNSGVFTLYALFEEPGYFDAYIASSAMIGYCFDYLAGKMDTRLSGVTSFDKVLFMNGGDNDSERHTRFVPQLMDKLSKLAPKDFRWTYEEIPGGGHVPSGTECAGLAYILNHMPE